jgi:branched-chain amino acid aminotransferase
MNACYFNGDIIAYEACRLHISDLQLQRGYGIFDFFRSRNGQIPWLEDYAARLFNSLALAGIETGLDMVQFMKLIHELEEKNKLENSAFKVIVSGGYSENLESVTGEPNVIILNIPWKSPDPFSHEQGVGLITHDFVRPNPEIKTLYYFNTLMLHRKLREFNAVDVLFHNEMISEASRANLFFVRKGRIITPGSHILEGVTRKQLLRMFGEIRVEDIAYERLFGFDEIFLTSSSRDVTPVVSVDGKKIGTGRPGPVTREILSEFRKAGF